MLTVLAMAHRILTPHYNRPADPVSETVATVWTDSNGTFHRTTN